MEGKIEIGHPQSLEDLLFIVMARREEISEFSSLLGQNFCTGDNCGGGGGGTGCS